MIRGVLALWALTLDWLLEVLLGPHWTHNWSHEIRMIQAWGGPFDGREFPEGERLDVLNSEWAPANHPDGSYTLSRKHGRPTLVWRERERRVSQ